MKPSLGLFKLLENVQGKVQEVAEVCFFTSSQVLMVMKNGDIRSHASQEAFYDAEINPYKNRTLQKVMTLQTQSTN